jgi:hypothetical protein
MNIFIHQSKALVDLIRKILFLHFLIMIFTKSGKKLIKMPKIRLFKTKKKIRKKSQILNANNLFKILTYNLITVEYVQL